jgi:hypothetical protein
MAKDSDVIKTTTFDGDKDQTDICIALSAGVETRSAGVKELPTAIVTVKGMWIKLVIE